MPHDPSTAPPSQKNNGARLRRVMLWSIAGIVGLATGLLLVLSISNWNFARGRIAAIVGDRMNRTVVIDGDITAHLLAKHPWVRIDRIVISSPAWAEDRDFATVKRLEFAVDLRELLTGDLVFESLAIDAPNIALISDAEGRTNFNFDSRDGSRQDRKMREPPALPVVRHFTVRGGELYVRDAIHKLTFKGVVEANENSALDGDQPFRLRGEGTLNTEPFGLLFSGGPLVNIRAEKPYQFSAAVTAGKTIGAAQGTFEHPFDFAMLTASIDLKGENLAHLYYLTNLALPFTPPYRLSGIVHTSKRNIAVDKLAGKIGSSDINGTLSVNFENKRPKLIANLRSESLNLNDLAPAIGQGVRVDSQTGQALDGAAPSEAPTDKLFPTYQFQFDRLASMDANVTLYAASVQSKKMPIKEVGFHITVIDSVLLADPLVFTLPQGKIAATVRVDAREKIAKNKVDIRATNIQLDQFKGKNAQEAPLDGVLEARMQISGTGNSVHDLAANATGKLNAVIPHGEIRKSFAELMGINVARGLGLLLAKDQTRTAVRCGIATIDIRDGTADVDQMVFDTETVLIKGDGIIELEPEKLDLDLSGHPKKFQLVRLRAPITVRGSLRKPAIGIDAGDAAKQVGVAALIGALFTPLTSALAFIDPGLAKDSDCAALLAEAERAQALHAKPANSSWNVMIQEQESSLKAEKF